MFKRSYRASKERSGRPAKVSRQSFRDDVRLRLRDHALAQMVESPETSPSLGWGSPSLNSVIIEIVVGEDRRLFAAHEDVLSRSHWFADACQSLYFSSPGKRQIHLPDELPDVMSVILQYLYGGTYEAHLLADGSNGALSPAGSPAVAFNPKMSPSSAATSPLPTPKKKQFVASKDGVVATTYHPGVGDVILLDTAVYCAALRYSLPGLQALALHKQGKQNGVDAGLILRSARFAYANTPDSDSTLRAHYLALIIRQRRTFKRSGTMEMEMQMGGTQLFFDLFVAMCGHLETISENGSVRSSTVDKK